MAISWTTRSFMPQAFIWAGIGVVGLLLTGCGSDSAFGSPGASGNGSGSGGTGSSNSGGSGSSTNTSPPDVDGGFKPETSASGWEGNSQGGVDNPGGTCVDSPGAIAKKLPVTGVEYCVKAHPDCLQAGASCPVYITVNTAGAFFGRVDDAAANGTIITAELYTETDGDKVKDKFAELPRVLAHDYPGLDKQRIYAIGWSAGAGAVTRGLCHISKKSDFSTLGTTSDIYAAVVALGGCGCSSDYVQLAGNWHIFTFNGMEDPFNGGDACDQGLRKRAVVNGCSNLTPTWQPIAATDAYVTNGTGSADAEKLDFGECAHGQVVGYRGKDEGHVVSFKKHFDPKISGYDAAFKFLQGKTK
jgi:hypothetical protein